MPATPATLFSDIMTMLTGNAGGNVQQLPAVNICGGRVRSEVATLTLAAQASGSIFGMFRIPLFSVPLGIQLNSSVSLGTATIAFGNAGNANNAIYAAGAVFTAVNTPTNIGLVATMGVPITRGYDCVSGLEVTYAQPGTGGALYEDIIMTTGVAALPASGTLRATFFYQID